MTYDQWAREKKQAEELRKLDRDPKGYFAAVELLDRLEKVMGEKV